MSGSDAGEGAASESAVILDYLPHGRPEDDRPSYQKSPFAYAVGERTFRLVELTVDEDAGVSIGDTVRIEPASERDAVLDLQDIEYEDLSTGARNELEYVVEEVIDDDVGRFVDFYNDAQPITLRLHQLNLLPGIGKKLRNNILDERKRGPFEDFEDLTERVSGLHHPKEKLIERVIEELRDEDLKYKTFVGRQGSFAVEGD
jgi:putative nucleotide binding protein